LVTVKIWRVAGVVLAATLLATVFVGASAAGNHTTFSDRVGDDSGGLAPDIATVDVTSADNGDIQIKIGINEQGGTFYVGDDVTVYVNSDLNGSTGITGGYDAFFEVSAARDASGVGRLTYRYCNTPAANDFDCHPYQGDDAKDEKTGINSHQVTFLNGSSNWFTVGLLVVGDYENPDNPAQKASDFAPDTGNYQYAVGADTDNDRIAGQADLCPRFPGGKFDTKGSGQADGCPPFYPVPNYTFRGSRFGGTVVFSRLAVPNAPGGATVTLRAGGRVVHRSGPGALPGIAGRSFHVGTTFTFIYSNPNYFGRYKVARVSAAGLSVVGSGCTPPGKTTFIDCKKVKG
jgi:hypothetical protein